MDIQRSTKHRSLNVDLKSQPPRIKRPSIGERHKSAPLVPQICDIKTLPVTNDSVESRTTAIAPMTDCQTALSTDLGMYPIVNLVVIGNPRVGKTTFIRNALGLKKTMSHAMSSSNLVLDNEIYNIRLYEIKLDRIEINNDHVLRWPKTIGDVSFAQIDGALCLYDVTNEKSIGHVPQALHAMSQLKLPIMMIACKSDAHISEQEVGITFIERVRQSFPLVTFGESSSVSIQNARRCLMIALKAVLTTKNSMVSAADSTVDNDNSNDGNDDGDSDDNDDNDDQSNESLVMRVSKTGFEPEKSKLSRPRTPTSVTSPLLEQVQPGVEEQDSGAPQTPDSSRQNVISLPRLCERGDKHTIGLPLQSGPHSKELTSQKHDCKDHLERGVSFAELVDRLLRMPVTKNNAKFVPAFLCLYRSFATPRSLLVAIMDRFALIDQSELAPLTKIGELLRYLQVISQWTAHYPNDFTQPSVRRLAVSFTQDLEKSKNFAPAAKEIMGNLLTIIMDDDRDWAYEGGEEEEDIVPRKSVASSFSSFSSGQRDSNQTAESENSEDDRDVRRRSVRNSGSASTASSIVKSTLISSQSATNLFNLENAREQSRLFHSVPHMPLVKLHWHQFMNTPLEELAREITRIDWTMFSAIRTRDFVRHVSLSSHQRARLKHGDTIGMMVKHFNHLALFVSGMILLRDKPKHRAKILEKFMDLAWKVRQLNNYNSLGAIVAGIAGPEISRLTQTYELISTDVQKQFLRLTVLMSHSRSHAAYRMAWENSFSERIPYIPLVRQDLTMAVSANPTFIGKNINWEKFEIMGDVIVGIHKSHERPYSFLEKTQRSQEITRLILETKVIEESEDSADPRSELYDKSVRLEPHVGGDTRKSVTGFGVKRTMTGWFQS